MVAIAVRRTKTVTKQEDGRLLISVTISVVHHYECRQIWQDDTEVAMWIRSRRDKMCNLDVDVFLSWHCCVLNSQNINATWASLFEEEIEENEIVHLLILEEYLKIRCFGYTNKLMEMYKNKKEVNLQKCKSFRAQVSSSRQ